MVFAAPIVTRRLRLETHMCLQVEIAGNCAPPHCPPIRLARFRRAETIAFRDLVSAPRPTVLRTSIIWPS